VLLLIDIGGTSICSYQFDTTNRSYRQISTVESQNIDFNLWIAQLISKLESDTYEAIIIGIPGETRKSGNDIFCPPLNCYIDKSLAKDEYVFIVNDMFIQAFLAVCSGISNTEYTVVVNIGTSIGVLLINNKFNDNLSIEHLTSYEFAHMSLTSNGSNPLLYDSIGSFVGRKIRTFCSIYSVGGFAAANLLPVDTADYPVLRVSREVLSHAINKSKLINSFSERWFNSLAIDLSIYINKELCPNADFNVLLRGGLHHALNATEYSYLSNIIESIQPSKTD